MKTIQQGQIVQVNLDPIQGREQRGTRPVVIISSNGFHASQLCIVCPLTTTLHKFVGDVILEPSKEHGLKRTSEVLCGHVRSVSQNRIASVLGQVSGKELQEIFKGVDVLLGRV